MISTRKRAALFGERGCPAVGRERDLRARNQPPVQRNAGSQSGDVILHDHPGTIKECNPAQDSPRGTGIGRREIGHGEGTSGNAPKATMGATAFEFCKALPGVSVLWL